MHRIFHLRPYTRWPLAIGSFLFQRDFAAPPRPPNSMGSRPEHSKHAITRAIFAYSIAQTCIPSNTLAQAQVESPKRSNRMHEERPSTLNQIQSILHARPTSRPAIIAARSLTPRLRRQSLTGRAKANIPCPSLEISTPSQKKNFSRFKLRIK